MTPEEIRQEAIAARQAEVDAMPKVKPLEDEDEYEYVPQHFQRKPEVKLPSNLTKAIDGLSPKNEPAAPLCLDAADPKECQLFNSTTNSINDKCCQAEKLPKSKKPKKAKKPLHDRVDYIPMYNHYISNTQYTWSEVIFLSEIDCLMQRKKAPCHVSAQHLASAARITVETAYNILSELEARGIIITLGYHNNSRTKDRIVAPKYSRFPSVSKQILKERGKEPAPF